MGGVSLMKSILSVKYDNVVKRLDATMLRVQRGTKKATLAACQEIIKDSKEEVPKDTETLAKSAFYEVQGSYKNFVGIVGYGGNGDPVNPRTGESASDYMIVVHEDLEAKHNNGKAKFLEDPVRRYASKFATRVSNFIKQETGM